MNIVLYRMVEENLRIAMRCYARVNNRGEARDYPGVSVASCGLNCAVFNSAMLNAPAREPEVARALSLAQTHFTQRDLGWTFWLCDDLIPAPEQMETRRLFRNAGMEIIAQPPGMYADDLLPSRRFNPELELRPVADATTRLDFAHLSSLIFSLTFETSKQIYGSPTLWEGPMQGWVGYLSGRAVCIVTVVIGGGVIGVYSVGTLPEHQRRGFAETAIRHAIAEAQRSTGLTATVLQSTPQGYNLYARMGYRVVTRFGVYLSEGNGTF